MRGRSHAEEQPQRKSSLTEEKTLRMLLEADTVPLAEVAKKHGAIGCAWQKRFGKIRRDRLLTVREQRSLRSF